MYTVITVEKAVHYMKKRDKRPRYCWVYSYFQSWKWNNMKGIATVPSIALYGVVLTTTISFILETLNCCKRLRVLEPQNIYFESVLYKFMGALPYSSNPWLQIVHNCSIFIPVTYHLLPIPLFQSFSLPRVPFPFSFSLNGGKLRGIIFRTKV